MNHESDDYDQCRYYKVSLQKKCNILSDFFYEKQKQKQNKTRLYFEEVGKIL